MSVETPEPTLMELVGEMQNAINAVKSIKGDLESAREAKTEAEAMVTAAETKVADKSTEVQGIVDNARSAIDTVIGALQELKSTL